MRTATAFEIPLNYPQMFGTFIHVMWSFKWLVLLCVACVLVSRKIKSNKKRRSKDAYYSQVASNLESMGTDSWRDDPASDKQKSFADSLGIYYPETISKGELSDLISAKTGR
jgi:hypothetical protein